MLGLGLGWEPISQLANYNEFQVMLILLQFTHIQTSMRQGPPVKFKFSKFQSNPNLQMHMSTIEGSF